MEKITAYKLSDGSIVETEKEALEKENELEFKKRVKNFCMENVAYTENQDILFNAIISHPFVLLEILMAYTECYENS